MKPYKKAVAVTGTYQDRQTGQEKKRYSTVGTLFQYDDGGLALKIETIPVSGWNGFISFYELDENRSATGGGSPRRDAPSSGGGSKSNFDLSDDDIPF